MSFFGKKVVITGGTGGIGLALTKTILRQGAAVSKQINKCFYD